MTKIKHDEQTPLGAYIESRLDALNLKQQDLAELLTNRGLSRQPATISHWINGKANVPFEVVPILAEVLKLRSPLKLYELAGYLDKIPGGHILRLLDDVPMSEVLQIERMIKAHLEANKENV